jgi:hypothetical protein
MHEYGFAPLRVRGVDRVALHADLTMLARLSRALARARAVRLAAYTSLTTDDQTQRILWWFALTVALGAVVWTLGSDWYLDLLLGIAALATVPPARDFAGRFAKRFVKPS